MNNSNVCTTYHAIKFYQVNIVGPPEQQNDINVCEILTRNALSDAIFNLALLAFFACVFFFQLTGYALVPLAAVWWDVLFSRLQ